MQVPISREVGRLDAIGRRVHTMASLPDCEVTEIRGNCLQQREYHTSKRPAPGVNAHIASRHHAAVKRSRFLQNPDLSTDIAGCLGRAAQTIDEITGNLDETLPGKKGRYQCACSSSTPVVCWRRTLPVLLLLCMLASCYDSHVALDTRLPPSSQHGPWPDNDTHAARYTARPNEQSLDTDSTRPEPEALIKYEPILRRLLLKRAPVTKSSHRLKRDLASNDTSDSDLSKETSKQDLFLDYYGESGDNIVVPEIDPAHLELLYIKAMQAVCGDRWKHLAQDEGQVYCNSTFDRVLCWPTTVAGELAIQSCPPEFAGIKYRKIGNASKVCFPNGTWEVKTDYNQCHPEFGISDPVSMHNYIVRWLYYVGFTVSIISCVVALFIFLYFKALRCVRNKIHCHLIVTFVLRNFLWLIMNNTFPSIMRDDENAGYQAVCKTMVTLFNYAQVTNFFWMLVEGLYLHKMIVWAFSIDRIKFWWYIVIGWCVPAIIVLVWVIVKVYLQDNTCWLPGAASDSDFAYIYIVPVLLVLVINVVFLISIVVVLITKLRASNTVLARQYKKAVKATVILLPLLGGTYILFICSPGEKKLVSNLIFIYFNTILQSTQGLAVTIFYCFLNGEVRSTIRSRWHRWQEGRTISSRYTRDTRGSMATTNGETIDLRMSFRGTNGISNGPSDLVMKSVTRNNNRDEVADGVLIHSVPDEETGPVDDSSDDEDESLDLTQSNQTSSRSVALLPPPSTDANVNI